MTTKQPPKTDPRALAEYMLLCKELPNKQHHRTNTMPAKQPPNTNTHIAAEFARLFGLPPVVNIGDIKIYHAILEGLAEEERPQSFLVRVLIRDVADLVYQRLWLRRLSVRLIWHAEQDHMQKEIMDHLERNNAILESGCHSSSMEDSQKLKALNDNLYDLTKRRMTELAERGTDDGAAYFLGWIDRYERVENLLAAADKKLIATLKLLDEYRDGLGRRVRQVADEIVDVEFEESSLVAREQQVATPPSSIGAVEPTVPSTQAMPPSPAAESVASPVEVSASSRPGSVRQRRRLQPAAIQRRRRSVPSTPSRGQSNATSSSGNTEPGKVPAPSQPKAYG